MNADEGDPEMDLAQRLVHHFAEHLGEPVDDGAEDSEQAPAEQHVMDVGDDEIGVVDEHIHRRGGHEDSDNPPITNIATKASPLSIAVV